MTRANARELAVHLIFGCDFTGEEPEQVISTRLNKEYYKLLSEENQAPFFGIGMKAHIFQSCDHC